jgi:cytochrome c biogenesis protein CcmG, thiol:disulfide interchange protein DsbE
MTPNPTSSHRPWAWVVLVPSITLVTLLAPAAGAGCASSSSGARDLPATELVTLDGATPISFDAYRGKPLVVNLWASWCTPCRTEMPNFERVNQQVSDRVTIVGLTDDPDLDEARTAAAATGVTYPLLVDTRGRFQSDLGITGLPATVFVDADGKVLSTHSGVLDEDALLHEIGRLYGRA